MRRAGLGEYLASLPYQFGYELDNHVVVIGLGESSPKLSAAFEWTDNRELIEQSEAFVAGFTPPMQKENIDSLLIVGYGPEGQERAQAVAATVEASSATPPRIGVVEVDQDHYRHIAPMASDRIRLPEPMPEIIVEGKVAPEVSPGALEATYAPLPQPTYPELDRATAARLDDCPPSVRADIGRRYLDQLADYQTPQHRRPELQSTLAYVTHTDKQVRDAVLVHSLGDRAKAEALVGLYRGAPESYRASVVPTAALSTYVAHDGGTRRAQAILEHGDTDNALTDLAHTGIRLGIPPREMHRALSTQPDAEVFEAADQQWRASRSTAVRAASFPPPAQSSTRATGERARHRAPGTPGKDATPER